MDFKGNQFIWRMVRYALFRGDKLVGRTAWATLKEAIKERDEWNKQFAGFNEKIKTMPSLKGEKPIEFVEAKEYRKKRQTAEQKLKEMFG